MTGIFAIFGSDFIQGTAAKHLEHGGEEFFCVYRLGNVRVVSSLERPFTIACRSRRIGHDLNDALAIQFERDAGAFWDTQIANGRGSPDV